MKVIEVEGKSIDEAVRKAADMLGVHFSTIRPSDIEVLDEGKSGIFGFGVSRSAKIRVSYSLEISDIGDVAKDVTVTLFEKMGIDAKIRDSHESESKVYIELESENSGLIIGKKGKTLEAVQFIINMIKVLVNSHVVTELESDLFILRVLQWLCTFTFTNRDIIRCRYSILVNDFGIFLLRWLGWFTVLPCGHGSDLTL